MFTYFTQYYHMSLLITSFTRVLFSTIFHGKCTVLNLYSGLNRFWQPAWEPASTDILVVVGKSFRQLTQMNFGTQPIYKSGTAWAAVNGCLISPGDIGLSCFPNRLIQYATIKLRPITGRSRPPRPRGGYRGQV